MRMCQGYGCEGCGLELQVIGDCEEYGTDPQSCEPESSWFVCCGESLELEEG
jgi:hypothetical protein